MYDSHAIIETVNERHNQFLREAQQRRLVKEAEAYASDQSRQAAGVSPPRASRRLLIRRWFARRGELAPG